MALTFKCDKCGAEIITKFLKLGEEAKCRSCGAMVKVPAKATGTEEAPDWIRRRDVPTQPEKEEVLVGYVPCPKCGSTNLHKIKWTFWGGVLGPSIFNHVKCNDCGMKFNGTTGKSNTGPIILYMIIGFILLFIILALCNR